MATLTITTKKIVSCILLCINTILNMYQTSVSEQKIYSYLQYRSYTVLQRIAKQIKKEMKSKAEGSPNCGIIVNAT